MGQAKLKGASRQERAQRALAEGRVKTPNMTAAQRDALLAGAVFDLSVRVLTGVMPSLDGQRVALAADDARHPLITGGHIVLDDPRTGGKPATSPTGRAVSNTPNLQALPLGSEDARRVRAAVQPKEI
jgi:hypothetical protein